MRTTKNYRGFTLVECAIVVAILSCIAALGVVRMSPVAERAKRTAALSDLKTLRDAFLDPEAGYLRDMRGIPGFSVGHLRLANLFIATNLYGAVENSGAGTTGLRVDTLERGTFADAPCARPEVFTQWSAESERGWRGPYIQHASGAFPPRAARRFADDLPAADRGFYPKLDGLRLPDDFLNAKDGCSIYGFPGEPVLIDPWGNPYVLQIPPPQAFPGVNTNVTDDVRFRFARVVSAGPDGRLDTPCFGSNPTNDAWATTWSEPRRRLVRQAGRLEGDIRARGDDLVLFLVREDTDEGADE